MQATKSQQAGERTQEKNYRVTIMKKNPAHDEMGGITYTTSAKGKAQAIRYIRREAEGDGHIGTGQGRYIIFAEESEAL